MILKKLISFIVLLGGLMSATAAEIDAKLIQAFEAKGPDYQPRTQHFNAEGQPRFINRLILEDSPYLNQHAHNPVDWYPWGSDAFKAAKQQDKPIFLSIGYSTCHWCHVMEEESFDNIEIANLMNEAFINIKVDREQRPEIDELYMTAVQLMTGHGGWPMSSFLTHDGSTFWAGTYLPPEQFTRLLMGLNEAWLQQRPQVEQQADEVAAAVNKALATKQHSGQISNQASTQAVSQIMQGYDELQGGFTSAPKFPNEPHLVLLLDHIERFDDAELKAALETTLDAMAQGGIYDQIGGGFHRYSVDNEWLVPHFEKMLYNQAQLINVYLQAYQLTGNEFYARVARQTLDYILRDMTSSEGGFYSATDADSEGEEGTYFVWTPEQIKTALPEQDTQLAIAVFGVTEAGNFEGKNILFLQDDLEQLAELNGLEQSELLTKLDSIIETLRKVRQQRVPPFRDQKVITAWNSMMISSLVLASEVLQEQRYIDAAERNLAFLLKYNYPRDQLWRVHLNGSSSIPATQEDYAYLAEALIALYDQKQDHRYLSLAEEMTDAMIAQFWDENAGGFYMNSSSEVPMMARVKQSLDGAIPAANAVAFNVLTLLTHRSQNLQYQVKADQTLAAFSDGIAQFPAAYSYFLLALNKQRLGETSSRRYAARGAVSIKADIKQQEDSYQLRFLIDIQDGWHINANKPLDEDLIATTVQLSDIMAWQLDEVTYPKAVEKQLGFSQKTLALYQGRSQITAIISKQQADQKPVSVRLRIQACSDKVCLAPENIDFKLVR